MASQEKKSCHSLGIEFYRDFSEIHENSENLTVMYLVWCYIRVGM